MSSLSVCRELMKLALCPDFLVAQIHKREQLKLPPLLNVNLCFFSIIINTWNPECGFGYFKIAKLPSVTYIMDVIQRMSSKLTFNWGSCWSTRVKIGFESTLLLCWKLIFLHDPCISCKLKKELFSSTNLLLQLLMRINARCVILQK